MGEMATRWIVVMLLAWVTALALGFALLAGWEITPGTASPAPARWPIAATISRSGEHPTIVMFAHPYCPCTRASLAELAAVMRDDRHDATATVVFFAPDDAVELDSPTWAAAGDLPRTRRVLDHGGVLAKLFGATTSGHLVIYDREGGLLFSGGITGSRGHVGDNIGRRSVLARLTEQPAQPTYDVFGCSLGGS